MCVRAHVRTHVIYRISIQPHVEAKGWHSGTFLNHFFTFLFQVGSLTEPRACSLRLAVQWGPRFVSLCPLATKGVHCPSLPFTGSWSSQLGSSCLHSQHYTHLTIFPAQHILQAKATPDSMIQFICVHMSLDMFSCCIILKSAYHLPDWMEKNLNSISMSNFYYISDTLVFQSL